MQVLGLIIGRLGFESFWVSRFYGVPSVLGGIQIKRSDLLPCRVADWRVLFEEPADINVGPKILEGVQWKLVTTDPNWRANKARVARESYQRHKDDAGAKEKRKAWYEQYKNADWYKEASKRAKEKFVASGKKAEADKRYSKSDAGRTSRDKARKQWREKFETEKGITVSSWRLKNDPQFKLHARLNTRISDALKRQGVVKASKTSQLIDAEIADFKAYLSANWEKGMSWDNYGRDGWHVDHIRPCASFDLTDEEQQLACFNWRNLRPMWAAENISKSDNYDPADEVEWAYMMRELGYEGERSSCSREGAEGGYTGRTHQTARSTPSHAPRQSNAYIRCHHWRKGQPLLLLLNTLLKACQRSLTKRAQFADNLASSLQASRIR
ncbi:hypothetical protein OMCYN_01728 [cyanobiont of Ornithocercus magnificus]|nr:hypothetical protein OMCYN_01728 [cyanobiont of Ornithocercus magnificus]